MTLIKASGIAIASVLVLMTPVLAAQLTFTPSISMEQEYTDNVFLDPDGFDEDDWITRARLGLEAALRGRTTGLELTYNPSYEWYDDFSENDGWIHDALALFYVDFSRSTRLELTDTFSQSRDPLSSGLAATPNDPLAPSALPTDPTQTGRGEVRRNATAIRLDHQFGADDTVYATAGYSFLRGLESPNTVDDNDVWNIGLGGTYWFTNFWGAETELTYANSEFDINDDNEEWIGRLRLNRRITRHFDIFGQYRHTILHYTEGASTDFEIYEPTVGFSYQLDQNTRIDIAAGWYFINEDVGDDDDDWLVRATADKIWPFRRGLFGLTLLSGQEIQDSGTEDLGLDIYYEGRARAEYSFSPRFIARATASYRYDDFPRAEPEFDWQTIEGTAGLEYQVLRWMLLNLDYRYRDRNSDFEADEYTENAVLFTITISPDRPFRASW